MLVTGLKETALSSVLVLLFALAFHLLLALHGLCVELFSLDVEAAVEASVLVCKLLLLELVLGLFTTLLEQVHEALGLLAGATAFSLEISYLLLTVFWMADLFELI